ncbi:Type I Iterative PKS [Gnomoniopsis sp. IMI 355080]|nr:Type I Iterative PKS [Gnomoniopsis sp. IMI 355080]
MSSASQPSLREALLLVGAKRSEFSSEDLCELRSIIRNDPDLRDLIEAITDLESLWPIITASLPELKDIHGDQSLHRLAQFIQGGDSASLANNGNHQDNILLEVLTVLTHVTSFASVTKTEVKSTLNEPFTSPYSDDRGYDIQGFCLGFLTAAAIAVTKSQHDFVTNIAAVLRIAVCIGALVEADAARLRTSGTQAVSLSIGWSEEAGYKNLEKILDTYHDAYIACRTDVTRVTITVIGYDANSIQEKLIARGFGVQTIALQGRYHCRSIHEEGVRSLKALLRQDTRFQLPNCSASTLKLRSNVDGNFVDQKRLHDIALDSILLEQCQWYDTVRLAAASTGMLNKDLIRVGDQVPVPRSLNKKRPSSSLPNGTTEGVEIPLDDASAVAIIGMGCRFPEADSLEEFWKVLSDGISTVQALPTGRFDVSDIKRGPKDGAFWGNFLRHPEHFDHRFFGISGREAKNMDPQQRILLEVAYEVLESAGFYGIESSPERFPADIGCYLGVGSVDYGDNVASHDATAFSALGTLRAFISGRAIRSGECSLALAGGVNVITSPALFQNLAGASFLSPTGASKAFDTAANGYCRGEGTGLVLLKSLARARTDGDPILAVITGSAVNHGANSSPITVPVSDSQTALYHKALSVSGTNPKDVSFVEAHGTGTPVGDPIECESIRRTFGGRDRKHELYLGSVKDNIGHTEAASGAAALIKTVLMMQKCTIPKQAGFTQLNPKIPALGSDHITIPRKTFRWAAPRRIAVINNYGAAGSNAAIVVQDISGTEPVVTGSIPTLVATELPFFLSSKDPNSLQEYCKLLQANLPDIRDLAYNLSVKQNRAFAYNYSFTASNLEEVCSKLDHVQTQASVINKTPSNPLPVVLCIGGQTGRIVHLHKEVFDSSKLLQKHLYSCEQACKSLGLPSLFPAIFSADPVQSLVSLHSLLFSLQYSSARAWLDAGLKVATIVGHSFGQLTALVVADALSLEDGLRFITARARLIEELWGHETGAMLSLQGDSVIVNRLLESFKSRNPELTVEVACCNGPESIVLAGDMASIDALENMVNEMPEHFGKHLKSARLKNTHAFHSSLVDGILPGLRKVADTLKFRKPTIRIEACSKNQGGWSKTIDSDIVVQHTRDAVNFHDALQRVEAQLGTCVFLEAGSASPIVPMARRALQSRSGHNMEHVFQPIDLGPPDSLEKLAKATSNLWAAGVRVQYWPFHRSHKDAFSWVNLPPYQFTQSSHWIDYLPPLTHVETPRLDGKEMSQLPQQLVNLSETDSQGITTFFVNTRHEIFTHCTQGHAVLGQSLCPASLYIELVIRAADLMGATTTSSMEPCVEGLKISAPLSLSSNRSVKLVLTPVAPAATAWRFDILSRSHLDTKAASTKHATGSMTFRPSATSFDAPRIQAIRRLTGSSRVEDLSSARDAHILNGAIVYQIFGQVVDYAPYYRGVSQIASRGEEAVGVVNVAGDQDSIMSETSCSPIILDNFLQVAGIHVNCLSEKPSQEVFVCTEVDELFISDAFLSKKKDMGSFTVYTTFKRSGTSMLVNDIFVFDPDTKALLVLFLGVVFQGMPIKSLARSLSRLNSDGGQDSKGTQPSSITPATQGLSKFNMSTSLSPAMFSQPSSPAKPKAATPTILNDSDNALLQIRELLSRVIEISMEEVKPSATLVSLGVDSLMSTEILNEIKSHFDVAVSARQLSALTDVDSLAQLLRPFIDGLVATPPPESKQDPMALVPRSDIPRTQEGISLSYQHVQSFLSNLLDVPMDEVALDASLEDLGIDSLMATEVISEIKQQFGITISAEEFQGYRNVLAIARRMSSSSDTLTPTSALDDETYSTELEGHVQIKKAVEPDSYFATSRTSIAQVASDTFSGLRQDFDSICEEVAFAEFYQAVYPAQMELVVAYIVEAFQSMGCNLDTLRPGDTVPGITVLTKHKKVKRQIYEILEVAKLIEQDPFGNHIRTTIPTPTSPSSLLHQSIVSKFPQHAFEHNLLASTGAQLADCLTGRTDPLAILFGTAKARTLMENVYSHAPMFKAGTITLAHYLSDILSRSPPDQPFRILELGAGTGGTTKHLIDSLLGTGRTFEYTFTDISSSLVAAARKKFAHHSFMRYDVLDIERPPADAFGQYTVVISTNCIHATKDLTRSLTNIRSCLRPDGVLCLVELTRNLSWFDLVFGLLEGWWLSEDGRQHALASEDLWRYHLDKSGFCWVDWTVGESEESNVLRVITASPAEVPRLDNDTIKEPVTMETLTFKRIDKLSLKADLYYSKEQINGVQVRPVALMIHGGGHVMLSRKDIRPDQTDMMLAAGFLPISVDYRLCPETTLPAGAMTDVRDALAWARNVLPQIQLSRSDIRVDGNRVVAVGWSTGGHLALSLGFTAPAHGIRPPDATLAFYCPSDYEDPFWLRPNRPFGQGRDQGIEYDLLEGVQAEPITEYNPPADKRALGGWMSTADPRSRIALHMNWTGRYLRILLNGLSPAGAGDYGEHEEEVQTDPTDFLPEPTQDQIESISPLAQIRQGTYRVPTFIIHGTKDDLIPWEQAVRTYDALRERGVPAEIRILEGAAHLFDLYRSFSTDKTAQDAVRDAYDMLAHWAM